MKMMNQTLMCARCGLIPTLLGYELGDGLLSLVNYRRPPDLDFSETQNSYDRHSPARNVRLAQAVTVKLQGRSVSFTCARSVAESS
jgi:hypothetical protein